MMNEEDMLEIVGELSATFDVANDAYLACICEVLGESVGRRSTQTMKKCLLAYHRGQKQGTREVTTVVWSHGHPDITGARD